MANVLVRTLASIAVVLFFLSCCSGTSASAGSPPRRRIRIVNGAGEQISRKSDGRDSPSTGKPDLLDPTGWNPYVVPPQDAISCPAVDVLAVQYSADTSNDDGKMYGNVVGSQGLHHVQAGDTFEYEYMWQDADCNCGVEFEIGHDWRLRDHGELDQHNFSAHSEKNTNVSAAATRQWLYRKFSMEPVVNRYVDRIVFSALLAPGRKRTAYYKYILIKRSDGTVGKTVWAPGMSPMTVGAYFPGSITSTCQPTTVMQTSRPVVHNYPTHATLSVVVSATDLRNAAAAEAAKGEPVHPLEHPLLAGDEPLETCSWVSAGLQNLEPTDAEFPMSLDSMDSVEKKEGDVEKDGRGVDEAKTSTTPRLPTCELPTSTWPSYSGQRSIFRSLEWMSDAVSQPSASTPQLIRVAARLRHRAHAEITLWDFQTPSSGEVGIRLPMNGANATFDPPRALPAQLHFAAPIPSETHYAALVRNEAMWEVNVTTRQQGSDPESPPQEQTSQVVLVPFTHCE